MKTIRALILFLSSLHALADIHAQDVQEKVVPELVPLQADYDSKSKAQVIQPYENAMADLNAKYLAGLENSRASAQKSGKLDEALAYKAEIESVVATKSVPSTDDAGTQDGLKKLRSAYRAAAGKLSQEKGRKLQPLKDAYSRVLDPLVSRLTKEGRLEDAQIVKARQDRLRPLLSGPLKIVGKWSTTQSNNLKMEMTFNKDYTYNYWKDTGNFSYKGGKYLLVHTWDWEIRLTDDNTFDGVCTRGEVGVKIHGERIP
jgi:hypothetical protein